MPTAQTAEGRCRLFDLPGELRNYIYDMVFDCDVPGQAVDLLSAAPPSKDLLSTSRTVYSETRGLYNAAYRRYWTSHEFTMTLSRHANKPPEEAYMTAFTRLQSMWSSDIQNIRSLIISENVYSVRPTMHKFRLVEDGWKHDITQENNAPSYNGQHFFHLRRGNGNTGLMCRYFWGYSIEQSRAKAQRQSEKDGLCDLSLKEQIEWFCGYGHCC